MSLLVRKDMESSSDPFIAHHLAVKRPSQLDSVALTTKRNKPDEETIISNVSSTSEQTEKDLNAEKSTVHVESEQEVCMYYCVSIYLQ